MFQPINGQAAWLCVLFVVMTHLHGCNTLDEEPGQTRAEKERWNSANEPTRFRGLELVTKFDSLPTSGRAERQIWPSTYWATHEDSINVRWKADELSPAEKYDQAFNGWTPPEGFMDLKPYNKSRCEDNSWDKEYYDQLGPLANHISRYMGNGKARDGIDNDGDGKTDECDDRDGVETWFGLCHAWVPAAMLEDRPLRSVTVNGVTFHTGDIEALIIAAYNRSGADMIGGRCNDKEVERDEQGRAVESHCRDSNPGTLHVIMTNYLGLNQIAFAEDRTYDYEVWNQPVVSYDITKMDEVTIAEANDLLKLPGETYTFNADAKFLYEVHATLVYITESSASAEPADQERFERSDRYRYILELDEERNVIGGEWIGSSQTKHPDFLWNPRRATFSAVPNLNLERVRELIRLSREPETPEPSLDEPKEHVFEAEGGIEIPDNLETGKTIELVVPTGLQGAVDVSVEIKHPSAVDLMVGLVAPTGEKWEVLARGAQSGENFNKTMTLDPAPVGDLGGTWRLVVSDLLSSHTGTVSAFGLKVTTDAGNDVP